MKDKEYYTRVLQPQLNKIHSISTHLKPLIAIRCMVYNHEKYLRDTLEGFIMQKTDFPFVAIVHDDASIDNSRMIIKEYAKKNPKIIIPIYESENQYQKTNSKLEDIILKALSITGAKYIAMCEGDDYWTDPLKLQKQVDFLESHPDYVMCSHSCTYLYQDTGRLWHEDLGPSRTYDLNNLAIKGEWLFQPLTILYRSDPKLLEDYNKYKNKRDAALIYSILKNGKGYLMEESMAMYRHHKNGVWSGSDESKRWDSEFSVRKGIYEAEKTSIAANYLENCLKIKTIGRKELLRKINKLIYIINISFKHKNGTFAIRDFIKLLFR